MTEHEREERFCDLCGSMETQEICSDAERNSPT